jgi:glycosyltransferase involved in cell wall biosynthesis
MIDGSAAEMLFSHDAIAGEGGALITVAVSLYNYADEIEACLDSVLAQIHPRLELLIVDDASTDRSAAIAKAWLERHATRFERAILVRHPSNLGLSTARNRAFEAARADNIFVLDADNIIHPKALSRLLEALEDSGAAAAYSQLVYFGEGAGLGVGNVWRSESFKCDNYVDAMALVSKAAWASVGGYSPMDYGWEDYDFWCKLIEAGLVGVYVPELLCRYRIHMTSMRHTDTTIERARLVHAMIAAHPWLDLKA